MRFYYLSVFSLILLGVVYVVGSALLMRLGSWLRRRWKHAWIVMVPLFVLLVIGPIAEELWIAWNFGQACKKDAGAFVAKTVEVEGFYYARGAPFELMRSGGYRWLEGPSSNGKGAERLALADAEFARRAKERLEKVEGVTAKPGIYRIEMSPGADAVVFTTTGEVWHIIKLDQPTARYHFLTNSGQEIGHKLAKQESRVVDTETGDAIGEYRVYVRGAPWFFVGLDRPNMGCDGPEGGPDTTYRNSFLIFRDVLKGTGASSGDEE